MKIEGEGFCSGDLKETFIADYTQLENEKREYLKDCVHRREFQHVNGMFYVHGLNLLQSWTEKFNKIAHGEHFKPPNIAFVAML